MTGDRPRLTPSAITFIARAAGLNALLYHLPLFSFAAGNLGLASFSGVLTVVTLLVVLLSVPAARLEAQGAHSQRDIFHTVMGAFSMHSDAYMSDYDIFSATFSAQ